jgi:hypothetical protein
MCPKRDDLWQQYDASLTAYIAAVDRFVQLERQKEKSSVRLLLAISGVGGPPNLAKSTCTPHLCANGALMEVVHLDGGHQGMTDEDVEAFLAGFPVSRAERKAII